MIDMIRVGQTRNLLRASSSLLEMRSTRITLLPEREVSGTAAKHSLVTSSMIVSTRNRRPFASWS
jgi:hypothetical protein